MRKFRCALVVLSLNEECSCSVFHDQRELSFRKGDVISLCKQIDKNWYEGQLSDGRKGLIPANYVEVHYTPCHTFTCACTDTAHYHIILTYIHAYIHTYIQSYTHAYTHAKSCRHTYTHTHTPIQLYIHTYIHNIYIAYTHAYIHTYIHTNPYTHNQSHNTYITRYYLSANTLRP